MEKGKKDDLKQNILITSNESGFSQVVTSSSSTLKKLDQKLESSISDLRRTADSVRKDFDRLEQRITATNTSISWMSGISLAFVLATTIIISLDYYKWSGDKHEKVLDEIQKIKSGYYSKEEINKMSDDFKDCIWFNGLSKCLRK